MPKNYVFISAALVAHSPSLETICALPPATSRSVSGPIKDPLLGSVYQLDLEGPDIPAEPSPLVFTIHQDSKLEDPSDPESPLVYTYRFGGWSS